MWDVIVFIPDHNLSITLCLCLINVQVSAFKAVDKSFSASLNRPMKSSLLSIVHRNKHGTDLQSYSLY